jgi:hypothetical protein
MINWHLDLFRNLSEVCLTMRPSADPSEADPAAAYARRLKEWRSIARYPDLVAGSHVVPQRDGDPAWAHRPKHDS